MRYSSTVCVYKRRGRVGGVGGCGHTHTYLASSQRKLQRGYDTSVEGSHTFYSSTSDMNVIDLCV